MNNIYYTNLENNKIIGFYIEDLHGLELCNQIYSNGGIKTDEELHQYILPLGDAEFIGAKEDREYTIEDKNLFEQVVPSIDETPQPPNQEERILALESLMLEVL